MFTRFCILFNLGEMKNNPRCIALLYYFLCLKENLSVQSYQDGSCKISWMSKYIEGIYHFYRFLHICSGGKNNNDNNNKATNNTPHLQRYMVFLCTRGELNPLRCYWDTNHTIFKLYKEFYNFEIIYSLLQKKSLLPSSTTWSFYEELDH